MISRFSLAGRSAVVTGGSRGIGRAIAVGLAEAGADIALTYRERSEDAHAAVEEITALGRRAVALGMDVTDRGSVEAAARDVEEKLGAISILVNNAGVNRPADFDKLEDADWDYILSTNLKGPYICAQVFLPLLSRSGHGSIIHIGSVSGQYGGPRTAHYAASKAGLISLAQVVARFGAQHGVRSNTIAAGLIASDMAAAGMASPAVQKASEAILLKRFGHTREVADAAVFLAGDASSYITAQTINVNGGLYF
jgi:NAD(P)-dependent dehydrogenase (short-subunit alcohol dehydrogenase family)